MNTDINNIVIAILGPVSAGKSTLLNGLFCYTMSEMARKRTTMLPQIYNITNNKNDDKKIKDIYKINQESNKKIFDLRQNETFSESDFVEITHNVYNINDFINNGCTYTLLDMPGLNDQHSQIYYNYISKISQNIDIYIITFDINSSLNTTDEVNILQFVVEQIKKMEMVIFM